MKPLKFILPATLLFSLAVFAQDEKSSTPPLPPEPPAVPSLPAPPPPPPPSPVTLKLNKHKGNIQKEREIVPPQKPVKPKQPIAPQPSIKEE